MILCKNLTLKSYVSFLVTRMKILSGNVLSSVRKVYVYVEIVCINNIELNPPVNMFNAKTLYMIWIVMSEYVYI